MQIFPWSILFSPNRGFLIAAVCLMVVNIGFNVLRMVAVNPGATEIRLIVNSNPDVLLTPGAGKMPV